MSMTILRKTMRAHECITHFQVESCGYIFAQRHIHWFLPPVALREFRVVKRRIFRGGTDDPVTIVAIPQRQGYCRFYQPVLCNLLCLRQLDITSRKIDMKDVTKNQLKRTSLCSYHQVDPSC